MRTLQFAVAGAFLFLSACATTPRIEAPGQPVDLAALSDWSARGRIAVAADGNGGSGSFAWEQSGEATAIEIQGPVGIGGFRLVFSEDRVRLYSGDGQTLESEAAWSELQARLGAPVPARNLRYWLLGIPGPGEYRWSETPAALAMLDQDGWQIVYERFSEQYGTSVPVRLTATSGTTRVRVIVDRWILGSGTEQ